ncbi:MAG: peptide chain release factor N(5)-glutamine methyltransferase, partial [Pseudomonadota bacterium]|nr:peptide chain release factor N(5)-glutamine methyltransferase [Pseudomonadota bacterium]
MALDIQTLLRIGSTQLAHYDTPRLEAEVLLSHVLSVNRSDLYAWPQQVVSMAQHHHYQDLLNRRRQGEPVAYLTGQQEFWSLMLQVTPATLIPRPETEVLVEQALTRIPLNQQLTLMDLGTGSGAIALAIAGERPQCSVIAIDNVAATLMIARHNAHRLGLKNIQFVLSDWLSAVATTVAVALIVSNPPYIATQDPHLHDIRYEPQQALIAGNDGLQALRHIISRAPAYLTSQGWLLVEHGYQQA